MKTMIEYLTTMIMLVVMMFSFSSITLAELEIIVARNLHTEVVEKLQILDDYQAENVANYFKVINDNLKTGQFVYEIKNDKVYVNYTFDLNLPLIGVIENNVIEGYAR